MAHNGRRRGTGYRTGCIGRDSEIRPVPNVAIPNVTLYRAGQNNPLRDEHLLRSARFWNEESDTFALPNVEVFEQKAGASNEMTSQPRQGDFMDLDPGRVANDEPHPRARTGRAALPEESSNSLSAEYQEMFRQRDILSPPLGSSIETPQTRARRRHLLEAMSFGFDIDWLYSRRDGDTIACQACLDPVKDPISVNCGHSYCRPCLNHLITSGIANRMSWPPKCCSAWLPIDVGSLEQHLDKEVFSRYLSVREEYSTRNPVYCSNKLCSGHIPSSQIQNAVGKFVSCSKCHVQTCVECKQGRDNHVGHDGTTCKSLEELMDARDRKLARSKQWKQCPSCKNLVERIDGCDRMRCSCGARFCYKCGTNLNDPINCRCAERSLMRTRRQQFIGMSQKRMSRKILSSFDSSRPAASSSSTSLSQEQLLSPGRSRPLMFPRPPRRDSRLASNSTPRTSTTDPRVIAPMPEKIKHPEPPLYDSLAADPSIEDEGNKLNSEVQEFPPETTFGPSVPMFGPSPTPAPNPAENDAIWSAASPMPPLLDSPFWWAAPGPDLFAGNPYLESAMMPLSYPSLPQEPQPSSSSTIYDVDPSLRSGYMNRRK